MASSCPRNPRKWILIFFYGGDRGIKPETKNFLLVAATLIAAATFQTGVNPPGGVWQETDNPEHEAGRAVFAQHLRPFIVFLVCNTLAFSISIHLILHLMVDNPFFLEIFVATTAMLATYWSAVYEITPGDLKRYRLILVAIGFPYVFQVCLELGYCIKKKLCDQEEHNKEGV